MQFENRAKRNNRFHFHPTPLEGLYVVERRPIKDQRGFFCRFFCAEEFKDAGFTKSIAQINHSYTIKKGAVRGLHFQYPPYAEAKIVGCLQGEVFDVAVDIRKGSPTFLQWHGEILSAVNQRSLLIPEGFAHGFQTLTEGCELIYLHSAPYCAQAEGALNVNDPRISVLWPVSVTDISDRDRGHAFLRSDFEGIAL
ncbi:MAG: dTDP-4-dehydrorhamnose 3,5-epimerase [Nitrospirota bacterium]|nr:dTDP-4-dehydrorhamnose 3,5-epimerase [Nitrospirota bacterium]